MLESIVVPASLAIPLTVGASLIAVAGAGLVLAATVFGDGSLGLWAGAAFAMAGVLWHAADRAGRR